MHHYQTILLTDAFTVEIVSSPDDKELSDQDKESVEKTWAAELAARPADLYNGRILSLIKMDGVTLSGKFIEYKRYLAYLRDPTLKHLNVNPVSLSGITSSEDYVLVGRRSRKVTQYPGYFELVPSGGVDAACLSDGRIDIQAKFAMELEEETGMGSENIQAVHPFLLAIDKEQRLVDICAHLKLQDGNHTPLGPTPECDELRWVSTKEIKGFLERHQEQMVPLSRYLLRQYVCT